MDPRRALVVALVLNGSFLLVELGVGLASGSLALLSDAAHMMSDVGSLVLALGAAQLALQVANLRMTFGLARAEVLGAFLNGVVLLLAAGAIVREAIHRLTGAPPVVSWEPVLVVGLLGLAINLGSAWVLYRSDRDNLNIRAALVHMLADALGSAGAIAAAGFLAVGLFAADAIVSLGIAALVAYGAVRVLRDAGRVLLELPPPGLDVDRMRLALLAVDGVLEVHDFHAWSVDGRHPMVSAHLVLSDAAEFDTACRRARAALHDGFDVDHATLQAERLTSACPTDCGVGARHD
jgi:cobalt-zinc-cadmium efflux system protein